MIGVVKNSWNFGGVTVGTLSNRKLKRNLLNQLLVLTDVTAGK